MGSSLFLHFFLGFLVLANEVIAFSSSTNETSQMEMEKEELLGVFEVIEALLDDPFWSQLHPQPCTNTPWPGLQCELAFDDKNKNLLPIFHVTKIHIGLDIFNPPCKSSAYLSPSLKKLPYLKVLSIFNCFLSSPTYVPPSLFHSLSSLEHLVLASNPSLTGDIPPSLGHITSLKVLTLSQNSLNGNIPKEIGGLVNLEQLDLSYNNLSGEIPNEISGCLSLTILDLSFNNLVGQVPYSTGQLQLLEKIDLGFNNIVGRIPPDLGKLKRLVLLDLSHNFIKGPIPGTFSNLKELQYLVADHNPINSGIPLFLGSLKKLTSMSLSGCGLIGSIPNSLSLLKNLTALALDNNTLIGKIPSSLGSLANLDQLNVSNNKLSGELLFPEEFIIRLGKRLDVRGNIGLCTSQEIYKKKNVSVYLKKTPVCLEKIEENGDFGHKIWSEENPNHESKGIQPSYISSSCSNSLKCLEELLVLCTFVLSFCAFFV